VRVIFVTHSTQLYGANRSLLNLIDGVRPCGVQPLVVAPDSGDITWALHERGVPVHLAGLELWVDAKVATGVYGESPKESWGRHRLEAFRRLRTNEWSVRHCRAALSQWKPDVVYSNSSATPFGAMLAFALRVPHVWHIREFLDLHYGFRLDWGRSLSRWALRTASARIFVSEALRTHHIKKRDPCSHVIYNGIATASEFDRLLDATRSHKRSSEAYTFACVGLVYPSKGQEDAVRAMASLNHSNIRARLLIVGGGSLPPLRELAASVGVADKVEFLGEVRDVHRIYNECDAILMCSRNEGMGRVTVEAMAHGLPVIGADSGGTPELVQSGYNGFLYSPGDVKALADHMLRLVEDRQLGTQMGMNGWRFARERCTTEGYANSVYQVLASVGPQCR
jgi:glycosyltransferase involved in cell wall biosynthesis